MRAGLTVLNCVVLVLVAAVATPRWQAYADQADTLCRFLPVGERGAYVDPAVKEPEAFPDRCKATLAVPVPGQERPTYVTVTISVGSTQERDRAAFMEPSKLKESIDIGEVGYLYGDDFGGEINYYGLGFLRYPYEVSTRATDLGQALARAIDRKIQQERIPLLPEQAEIVDATDLFRSGQLLQTGKGRKALDQLVAEGNALPDLVPDGVSLFRAKLPGPGAVTCLAGRVGKEGGFCEGIGFTSVNDDLYGLAIFVPPGYGEPGGVVEPPSLATAGIKLLVQTLDKGLFRVSFSDEELTDDGYWEWLVKYLDERKRLLQEVEGIKEEVERKAGKIRELWEAWLDLLIEEMEWFEARDILETSVAPPPRERMHVGGWEGTSPPHPGSPQGPQMERSSKQQRKRLRTQINDLKEEQGKLIEEGLEHKRAIRKMVEDQAKKSGDRREGFAEKVKRLKGQEKILRIQLYHAAEWYGPHKLPKLIREMDLKNVAPEMALLMRAKAHLAEAEYLERHLERILRVQRVSPRVSGPSPRGPTSHEQLAKKAITARFRAMLDLRSLIDKLDQRSLREGRLDYEDAQLMLEARLMLQKVELYWLGGIGAKLEREKEVSLAAFRDYLKNHGFEPEDPPSAVWDLWARLGLGPVSMLYNVLDIPGAAAEKAGIAHFQTAKHLVSLRVMIRLVQNGVTLPEIRNIVNIASKAQAAKVLAEKIVLDTASGARLPADKAERMVKDIQETLWDLKDLRALVDGDLEWFNQEFVRDYFELVDAEQSWLAWTFDALSPRNVALTLLGIKAEGVGMKLARLGKEVRVLRPVRALRYRYVTHHLRHVSKLEGWDKVAHSFSAVGAAVVLMGEVHFLAGEYGGPGAQRLVDAIVALGAYDVLFGILSRTATPVAKLASRVDDLANRVTKQQEKNTRLGEALDELERLARQVRSRSPRGGVKVNVKRRLADLKKRLPPEAGKGIPDSLDEGVEHAARGLIKALEEPGDVAEAGRALGATNTMREKSQERLGRQFAKTTKAQGIVGQASGMAKPSRLPSQRQLPKALTSDIDPEPLFAAQHYIGKVGKELLRGDEAFRRGNLGKALKRYKRAWRKAMREMDPSEFEKWRKLIEKRQALAASAREYARQLKALAKGPRLRAHEPIPNPERVLDQLWEEFAAGTFTQISGSKNPVWKTAVEDAGGKVRGYFVKRIAPEAAEKAAQEAWTEVAASALAREVGVNAPAVRAVRGRDGLMYVVSREVEVPKLPMKLHEDFDGALGYLPKAMRVALKKEYAKQRAFRAWLADTDGHLWNQLLGADGRLWQIDHGLANLKDNLKLKHLPKGKEYLFNEDKLDDFVEAAIGFHHGSVPGSPGASADVKRWLQGEKQGQYRWIAGMDQMVHYKDMDDVVKKIQELSNDRGRLRKILKEAGYPEAALDKTVDVLTERAEPLEGVLRKWFADPIKVGSLWPRRSRHAALPWQPLESLKKAA